MARKMGRNLKRAAAGLMACAAIALCAVSPAWGAESASDVVNVTVPTRIECALGADGTVTAPGGLEVVNLGPQDLYVGASTVDDFGQKVEFAMDLGGSPLLSRAGGKDVEGEVEFAGSSRKGLGLAVSKLNRTSHAALMDAAAQGEAPMFTVGFRFTFKALQGSMSISGEAKLGKTLTATVSGAQADAKLAYRWYRDGQLIAGAETATYTTNDADLGKKLKCEAYDAAGRYVGAVSAEVGPIKGPEAFAVFSADDGSLNFYKRADMPKAGERFEGKTATEVYTGFENRAFWSEPGHEGGGGWEQDAIVNTPWFSMAKDIIKVTVIDRGIAPKKLQGWFQGLVSCKHFDLEKLDTSKSTSLSRTFTQCRSAQTILCSSWNTENIETMHDAFYSCISLKNIDLSKWNTNRVTTFHGLFAYCESIEIIDLSNWNTAALADMSAMFKYCTELKTIDLSNASTENLMTMSDAFYDCRKLQQIKIGNRFKWLDATGYLPTPSSFDIPGADGKWYALSDKKGYAPADIPSNKADTYVASPDMLPKEAFAVFSADDGSLNFYKRTIVPAVGSQFEGKTVTSVYTGFEDKEYKCVQAGSQLGLDYEEDAIIDTPWHAIRLSVKTVEVVDKGIKPISLQYWFSNFQNCTSFKLNKLDTTNVTSLSTTFNCCRSAVDIQVSTWNVERVKHMIHAFLDCRSLNVLDLSGWNTPNNYSLHSTWNGCRNLTELKLGEGWDTSKVTRANYMFYNCRRLKTLDLNNFDTSNIREMTGSFNGCSSLSEVKLGNRFNWSDTQTRLPIPNASAIPGADGYWYDVATGEPYKPEEIPSNKAATYVAVNPVKAPTVTISGEAIYGSTLTARVSGQPADTTATSYQWQCSKNGKDGWEDSKLNGAQTSVLELTENNLSGSPEGFYYRCVVSTAAGKKRVPQGISEAVGPVKKTEAFAVFSEDDGSLNFYKRAKVPEIGSRFEGKTVTDLFTGFEEQPAAPYAPDIKLSPFNRVSRACQSITVIDEGISPITMESWFIHFSTCRRIDLAKLHAKRVKNLRRCIYYCDLLEEVDLSGIEISEGTIVGDMLEGLPNLRRITVGPAFSWSSSVDSCRLDKPSLDFIPGADGKWYAISDGMGYAPDNLPNNKADTYYASKSLLPVRADEAPEVVVPEIEPGGDVAGTEADSAVEVGTIGSEAVVPGEVENEEAERKPDEDAGTGSDGDEKLDESGSEIESAAGTPPEEEEPVPVTSDEAQ